MKHNKRSVPDCGYTTGWATVVFIQEKLRITARGLFKLKIYTHMVGCYLTKKSDVDEER